jgi:hypothetical protein
VYYIAAHGTTRNGTVKSVIGQEPGHDGGSYEFVRLIDIVTGQ